MVDHKFAYLGFGSVVAAGVIAVSLGYLPGKPAAEKPASAAGVDAAAPAPQPAKPAPDAGGTAVAAMPQAKPQSEQPAAGTAAPAFDILRVEPSGSIVIAGKAAGNATVDVLSRSSVIGTAKASGSGDFVIALDEPLKPGDYQLVLRSTGSDGTAMTSMETAIVSIPEEKTGQVLALVEQSGQPSRMITTPKAVQPAAPETGQIIATVAPKGSKPIVQPAVKTSISVEAVEIEGNKLFVAGTADAGSTVRVYANSDLLGSTTATPDGRFLVQAVKELPVGDYIVRAEMLAKDGVTIVAKAAVPFKREAGERVAAVAADAASGETAREGTGEPAIAQASAGDAASPLQNVDGSVIIRRGDNLWRISRRTYGKGMRYTTIYLANKEQIRNPNMIFPGQVFALPEQDKSAVE